MAEQFSIPEKYELSFRRFIPYLAAPLQNNPEVLSSLLLYLKMGGEKLARIAIDALNVSHRLEAAEMMKLLREEALNVDIQDAETDDDESSDEDEDEDADADEDEPATATTL